MYASFGGPFFFLPGFELGVVEYGAVIEAFEQSGKPEKGLEIFDDMVMLHISMSWMTVQYESWCHLPIGSSRRTGLAALSMQNDNSTAGACFIPSFLPIGW